ncbi:hypothetical protein ASD64_08865 [Mesorhizobium sp. Root157]|uniref:hypothetical protein n=1 Tax=Mesorhizobium sp. Root157 TaxID=1736477 RepID=UPI000700FC1C|nr:hypothetical protein [Mesorhizobium sp. Root157]KQZ81861.1 hypothetical protein ASD64_08865 [Mesorhizobium sp. Root157]
MADPHDWLADPRSLAECLKDFNRRLNGGAAKGSREAGQAALGIGSAGTYAALHKESYITPWERPLRLAMIEAERRANARSSLRT